MPLFPADYNITRLAVYIEFFDDWLRGKHEENMATNLMMDVKWSEVAKAFVTSLTQCVAHEPLRPLAAAFETTLEGCAKAAFGTSAHQHLPSWFLQNYEAFLASSTHKLLRHYCRHPTSTGVMRGAFSALLQVAEGARRFTGFAKVSCGAHALMAACQHSRTDFLTIESSAIAASHLVFAEVLASAILADPARSMLDRHNALSFFARSDRWQALAKACAPWLRPDSELSLVHGAVRHGVLRMHEPAEAIATLASAFLATSPRRVRSVVNAKTPTKLAKRAIRKQSTPFVKLVRKLVAP